MACFTERSPIKVRPQNDACSYWLRQEVEYIEEGKNADRFRRNFRDVPWVQTPAVHWTYTSPRVITLDYMPGTKASAASNQGCKDGLRKLGVQLHGDRCNTALFVCHMITSSKSSTAADCKIFAC